MNKKYMLLVALFTSFLFGSTSQVKSNIHNEFKVRNIIKQKQSSLCQNNIYAFYDVKRRGCCNHHGGVDGCSTGGRVICNDGTLSPSCTCNH